MFSLQCATRAGGILLSKSILSYLRAILLDRKTFFFSISVKGVMKALALDSSLVTLHGEVNGISDAQSFCRERKKERKIY